MSNNNLILRTVNSPWTTPTTDFTKNSVLSHTNVDNNFIYLRGELIYTAQTVGNTVTLKKINGNDLSFNVGSGGTSGGSLYWTSGSSGNYSIKVINDGSGDTESNYTLVSGFNNIITDDSEYSSIMGGSGNTIGGSINGHILGGYDNSVNKNSDLSVVIAGSGNTIGNGSTYSSIINGFGNEIGISNHSHSSILGGQNNQIGSIESINTSIIGGSGNTVQGGDNSTLIGGAGNVLKLNSDNSTIMGGTGNTIDNSDFSTIIGGVGSSYIKIEDSTNSTIIGLSQGNAIPYIRNSFNSAILAGEDHQINYSYNSLIIGGQDSDLKADGGDEIINDSVVIGGYSNGIVGPQNRSSIMGGSGNTVSGYFSTNIKGADNFIVGGVDNQVSSIERSGILGGTNNLISGESGIIDSIICGGNDNIVSGDASISSFIGGGSKNYIKQGAGSSSVERSAIIGGSGNTLSLDNQLIENSVILGGNGISATSSNTVYVPNLEVRGQAYTPIHDNLTGGTTFIPDWDNSNVQILTLSGNTNVSGGTSTMEGGSVYTVIVKQSNGGSHTITWDSTYKWEEGNYPTLSTAGGSVDIITFICDGTSLHGLIAKDFQ